MPITETRQMKVEDFLTVMEMNPGLYPGYDVLPDEKKRLLGEANIVSGEAMTYYNKERLVGVGGMRLRGMGEAWLITPAEVRSEEGLPLFVETLGIFKEMRDRNNLWRVFAENVISETFLKRLEFEAHPKGFVWTRT